MVQKNEKTGNSRPVKREISTASSVAAKHNDSQPPVLRGWCWQENDNTWHPFTGAISVDIDAKYRATPNGISTFQRGKCSYLIDFQTMEQTNLDTGETRQIMQRSPDFVSTKSATFDLPDTWDINSAPTDECYQLVDVAPDGSTAGEYQAVTRLFNESMLQIELKSVKRVQNKLLWEAFALAKRQLEDRMGHGNGVRQLFHGGNRRTIDGICAHGFDWRLSGESNGTVYGSGSYFALEAKFARIYADSNMLIVAQVLVGEFAMGASDIKRPPPKDPSKPTGLLYDSCVNDLNHPTIFVVFERAHSYPEYIIEY